MIPDWSLIGQVASGHLHDHVLAWARWWVGRKTERETRRTGRKVKGHIVREALPILPGCVGGGVI